MKRQNQKEREKHYAEYAAKLLGKSWEFLSETESPDFKILEGRQKFGLEVSDVFQVKHNDDKYTPKQTESFNQKLIDQVRQEYEGGSSGTTLSVKLIGKVTPENLATIVPALKDASLDTKPISYQYRIETTPGFVICATRSFRPYWVSVRDRVGFVDRNPMQIISDAIEKKSLKLQEYRLSAGPDIRLLLVADRILNSGKLSLTTPREINTHGFSHVYFLSYPENIQTFQTHAL